MKNFLGLILLLTTYSNIFAQIPPQQLNLTEGNWRWRNDDGTEITATWKAAENVPITLTSNSEILRLRLEVYNNSEDPDPMPVFDTLQYATSPLGPWTNLDTLAGSNAFMITTTSSFVLQDEPTTEQLTALLPFPFIAGKIMVDSAVLRNYTLPHGIRTEFEWVIRGTSNLIPNATYYFRQWGTTANPNDADIIYPSLKGLVNKIKGSVYIDVNHNDTYDLAEELYPFDIKLQSVKENDTTFVVANNGHFIIETDTGNYVTKLLPEYSYLTPTPSSHNSSFTSYFNTDSINFGLQPLAGVNDLSLKVIPLRPARPGSNISFLIAYSNIGTESINNAQLKFALDPKLNFINTSPTQSSILLDTLYWNLPVVPAFDTLKFITIDCSVKIPPLANLGDTITVAASINFNDTDSSPENNSDTLKLNIIGSFDPNDKSEGHAGKLQLSEVQNGEFLNYFIRFQNTGNDTAFKVVIRDTLSEKLDRNSFQMISSSHPYSMTLQDDNAISWTFSDINLLDSNANEPASHGFLAYRIKPNNTVAAGDIIPNAASIYFDFNLPVETNDAPTVVESNVVLPLQLLSFTGVYHNEQAVLHWSTAGELNVEKFEIQRSFNAIDFISISKVLPPKEINTNALYDFTDNLTNTPSNTYYYRLKMTDRDGKMNYSQVLLLHRNNKHENSISIRPNPVIGSANVYLTSSSTSLVNFQVIDVSGRIILKQKTRVFAGDNSIVINNIHNLRPGFYIMQAITGNNKLVTSFTVTK